MVQKAKTTWSTSYRLEEKGGVAGKRSHLMGQEKIAGR